MPSFDIYGRKIPEIELHIAGSSLLAA